MKLSKCIVWKALLLCCALLSISGAYVQGQDIDIRQFLIEHASQTDSTLERQVTQLMEEFAEDEGVHALGLA